MQFLALFALFVVASASEFFFGNELDEDWENFKKKFGKQYSGEEEKIRRSTWEQEVREILHHNLKADLGSYSFRVGLNEFSDMSHEEFVRTYNGFRGWEQAPRNGSVFVLPPNVQVPRTVDWREAGLVGPVLQQGHCGSCWAFSATGSLEGQYKKKTGNLVPLSKQNLVDCTRDPPYRNEGCKGGLMDAAFRYIQDNRGIDTEESYPYIGRDGGQCRFQSSSVGATVTGYVDIPSRDEDTLLSAVGTVGPVSVAIDASLRNFKRYTGGIYNDPTCSTENLDHAVLAVGYGSEDGQDYWLVKNSWGPKWGESGYVRMARNKNQCGIAKMASYPLV